MIDSSGSGDDENNMITIDYDDAKYYEDNDRAYSFFDDEIKV